MKPSGPYDRPAGERRDNGVGKGTGEETGDDQLAGMAFGLPEKLYGHSGWDDRLVGLTPAEWISSGTTGGSSEALEPSRSGPIAAETFDIGTKKDVFEVQDLVAASVRSPTTSFEETGSAGSSGTRPRGIVHHRPFSEMMPLVDQAFEETIKITTARLHGAPVDPPSSATVELLNAAFVAGQKEASDLRASAAELQRQAAVADETSSQALHLLEKVEKLFKLNQ